MAISVVEMGLFLQFGRLSSSGELLVLCLLIGTPGLAGIVLGKKALTEIRATSNQLRGRHLALTAIVTWPILLADGFLLVCLIILAKNFYRYFGETPFFLGELAILVLNILIFWKLIIKHGWKNFLSSARVILIRLRGLPRNRTEWIAALIVLALVLSSILPFLMGMLMMMFSSLAGFLTHIGPSFHPPGSFEGPTYSRSAPSMSTPSVVVNNSHPPTPLSGYYISEGLSLKDDGKEFKTSLSIPAGYALTVSTVLRSNQVVIGKDEFSQSAFVLAPASQQIEGSLAWRLLGNTVLADGAPLEFSLGINQETNRSSKTFHLISPMPLTIDWVSEPSSLWPPQNGHTKFLLMKGYPQEDSPENQPLAEWTIGIETRLDPIPENCLGIVDKGTISLGSNWLSTLKNKSNSKPAAPSETPNLEVP